MGEQYKRADVQRRINDISGLIFCAYRSGRIRCMDTIGKRVKQLRTARHLTQEQLAGLIGVKQSAISQIENGQTSSLSGDVLAGLCQHLVSTPSYILSGGVASASNAAVKLAELSSLAQGLSDRALETLLVTARALTMADSRSAADAVPQSSEAVERPALTVVPTTLAREEPAPVPSGTLMLESNIDSKVASPLKHNRGSKKAKATGPKARQP